jgi:hypothetical protein
VVVLELLLAPLLALVLPAPPGALVALKGVLPDVAQVAPWRAARPPAEYDRTTLSNFIDGGAELYVQYGFARAIAAEYASGTDAINCTVYEMSDSVAAFGVFSYFRTPQKAPVKVGDGGVRADLQLSFWQDRYFVTIETFSLNPATREGLSRFAEAMSARIGSHAAVPAVMRRLPGGARPGSEKLWRGDLATNALYAVLLFSLSFDKDDVLLAAQYAAGREQATLWLVPIRDGARLKAAWAAMAASLGANKACRPDVATAGEISCQNEGHLVVVRRLESALAVVSGVGSREEARAVLARIAR